jgi:hypothetical protein
MSFRSTLILVRFLLTFINRRVFGRGILRSKTAKTAAIATALTAFVGYGLLTVVAVQQYFDAEIVEILLLSGGVATPFLVLIAYTIVRVLFLKADELTQLTFMLPATNRERTLAFAIFEALMVIGASLITFGAFIIAAATIGGFSIIWRAVAAIFFPTILCYLLFSIAYLGVERLVITIGAGRLRGLIIPFLFAAALVGMFTLANSQSQEMLQGYLSGQPYFIPQLGFLKIADSAGPALAVLVFLILLLALGTLVLIAAPKDYEPVKQHYRVLSGKLASSQLGLHLLALVRSFETLIVLLFVTLATAGIAILRTEIPPYVLLFVTFQGVYAFANSEPIRRATPALQGAVASYLNLVTAQAIVLLVVAVPAVAVSTWLGVGIQHSALAIGLSACNILLSTLVGILFPADNGNPFSVVVGVVLVFAIVAMVAMGLNIFSLPVAINVAVVVLLAVAVVAYSIVGINRIERIRRYEIVA